MSQFDHLDAAARQLNLAPGRASDWQMLQQRIAGARSEQERNRAEERLYILKQEGQSKVLSRLREDLVRSSRVNDNEASLKASERIHQQMGIKDE